MAINNLWVIMPVYNEEEAISTVIEEWQKCFSDNLKDYTFCILNDGSKDGTLTKLKQYEQKYTQIKIIDKSNSGHGQTCIYGYKLALDNNAEWVFQIDSDGQCSSEYFPQFVQAAEKHKVVYGFRKTRDDGLKRALISRFVSIFAFFATGYWVKDPNVPYRLLHRSVLEKIAGSVPPDFQLANILVSILAKREAGIKWIDIHFRRRSGGTPSVKNISFIKQGFKLFRQLNLYLSS